MFINDENAAYLNCYIITRLVYTPQTCSENSLKDKLISKKKIAHK